MEATLITLKRKNILNVIEYCLDNKIEFNVKDKAFGNDEFDLTLSISDIKTALAFGYYARDNRIEIPGVSEAPKNIKSKPQARTNTANNLIANKGQESSKMEEIEMEDEEEENEIENETSADINMEINLENNSEIESQNDLENHEEVFEEISSEGSKSSLFGN